MIWAVCFSLGPWNLWIIYTLIVLFLLAYGSRLRSDCIHYSMITIIVARKWLKRPYSWSSPINLASHWALSCTVYFIWKDRNRLIFEGVCLNIDEIFFRVEVLSTNEFTCTTRLCWSVLFWIRGCLVYSLSISAVQPWYPQNTLYVLIYEIYIYR